MTSMIRGIYKSYFVEQESEPEIGNPMSAAIQKKVEQFKDREDYERIQEMVYDAVNIGQEYAFESGFQFAVALLLECIV